MTDEVSVTQADRDAAAAYWRACGIGTDETRRHYAIGKGDDSNIVQAFARHREAHTALLAKPLLTLVQLVREYLPSDGIPMHEFVDRVLGVLDNDEMAELVAEMEGRK